MLTTDLDFKGVPARSWEDVKIQIQEIEGVRYVEIDPSGHLVVSVRFAGEALETLRASVDAVLEHYRELPVGIRGRDLEGASQRRRKASRV